jgi:hypothetical protein
MDILSVDLDQIRQKTLMVRNILSSMTLQTGVLFRFLSDAFASFVYTFSQKR